MLSLNKLLLFKNKIIHLLSEANHPCKHFGTGPFVINSHRPISIQVLAQRTSKPTRFASFLPHTIDASITPSSSFYIKFVKFVNENIKMSTNLAIGSSYKYWFARIAVRLAPSHCGFSFNINLN